MPMIDPTPVSRTDPAEALSAWRAAMRASRGALDALDAKLREVLR